MSDTHDNLQFDRAESAGTAADWVDEAAKRAEHKTEKPVSWFAYPATYTLIGVNVLVYALMFRFGPVPALLREHAFGSAFTAPFEIDTLLRFGGSASWLVLGGEWWRLLTATFVHSTFLHIALNLWCLWNLGLFGEPLLGKPGLVAVYLLTGIAGNLLSLILTAVGGDSAIVVGASGAVFGIAGILIVLLSNKKLVKPGLSWAEIRGLRSQVILFAVANLVLGLAPQVVPMMSPAALHTLHVDPSKLPRIDNSAHLGGFLCGLALGLPLFSKMTTGKRPYRARQRVVFASAGLVVCLVCYALKVFEQKQ